MTNNTNCIHEKVCKYANPCLHDVENLSCEYYVEPKQGEWVNGRCSNCDCKRPNEYASVHSETGTRKFYPLFCWNCGARMKEGDEK